MSADAVTTATLVLTAVSSLGALGAAIASFLAVRAARLAAEAQVFSLHFAEYGLPEMLDALRVLRMWQADSGEEFAVKWKRELDAGEARAYEVDRARRHVKFYFLRGLKLYKSGYTSKRFLRQAVGVDGINILFDIVEPLEIALNPASEDPSSIEELRQICGRVGTKGLIAPVPPRPPERR